MANKEMQTHVRQSLIGARIFYVAVFGCFYIACLCYRNQLTESFAYTVFWYIPLTVASWMLFITTSKNPGYLDEHPSQGGSLSQVRASPIDDGEFEDIELAPVTVRRTVGGAEEEPA